MHGSIHAVSTQVTGQSQAALVRTSAAQEAAAMRRKLVRAAAAMETELGADAAELLGEWKRGDQPGTPGGSRASPARTAAAPSPVLPLVQAVSSPWHRDLSVSTSLISYRV